MLYEVLSIALTRFSPIVFTLWITPPLAALECASLSGNSERCADVIGMENQEITIQTEEIINNSSVIYGEQQYFVKL